MAAKSAILDPTLTKIDTLLDMKIKHKIPENYANRTRNVFFGFFSYILQNKMAAKSAILDPTLTKIGTLLNMNIRHKIHENYANSFINVTSIVKKLFLQGR